MDRLVDFITHDLSSCPSQLMIFTKITPPTSHHSSDERLQAAAALRASAAPVRGGGYSDYTSSVYSSIAIL